MAGLIFQILWGKENIHRLLLYPVSVREARKIFDGYINTININYPLPSDFVKHFLFKKVRSARDTLSKAGELIVGQSINTTRT